MNRYDSYKDLGVEWIGEIPSHWVKSKLKYNNQISLSNIDKKEYEHLKPHPIIHYNDVIKYGDIDKSIDLGVGYCSESQYLSFKVSLGDIIITKDSMDVKNICDSTIITEELEGVVYGYHLMKLSNERNEIHPRFTYYFFKNVKTKEYFLNNSNGTTIIGVSKNTVENTIQLLLPLSEQQQIVSFLDTKTSLIDSLFEKTQRKIELLKEKRTSLINEVVTKGLNPNVEMKDSGVEWIGEIPRHWDRVPFKYEIEILTDFTSNGSFKSLRENVEYLEEGYSRLVRLTDLRVNLENGGIFISEDSHNFLGKSELFGGEILISCVGHHTGYVTKMLFNKGKCSLGPNMYLIRNRIESSDVDYLIYLLNSDLIQSGLKNGINKTTQEKINKDNVKDLQIVRPPLSEQQQIVEYLDEQTQKIDKTISIEEKRIELLKEYRQSLISELVTGKRKVVD